MNHDFGTSFGVINDSYGVVKDELVGIWKGTIASFSVWRDSSCIIFRNLERS